ncbi:MAG: cyclic nucleotide-binding domain-containing protein [Deltaproteobacteria bacterium]|nr:cyclic nucleotide-binding domain-containing protein [Deltaproteobacteria bacterium]
MTDSIDPAAFEARFADYLSHLGGVDVAALASVLERRPVRSGDVLISQGAPHGELLFVDSGILDVTVANASETPHTVASLEAGAVVGEVGVLAPGPATATVSCAGAGVVFALRSSALDALWSQHPAVASSLVQALCQVMARRIRSVEGDLDRLHDHERGRLGDLLNRLFGRAA